jgi:protein tyrosine phosphatase (PTP) superfamily phosphohydrolase (DUF442 family)
MMMRKQFHCSFFFLLTLFATLFFQQSSSAFQQTTIDSSVPSLSPTPEIVPAEKLSLPGLPNSGRVTENLFRGGQPKPDGYQKLKDLGITLVVDFHNTGSGMEHEKQIVQGLGMRYISLPASVISGPTDEQIAEFLKIVVSNPNDKVFVHCNLGADRTGVAVAAFRMTQQQWNVDQAFTEMHKFHFHTFLLAMKSHVRNFPEIFAQHPAYFDLRKPLPPAPAN